MKIAGFADMHAHNYREFDERTDRTGSKRLDNILDTLDEIKQYCLDNGIKVMLFGGDLFHVRAKVDTIVFNSVYEKIKEIAKEGINIIAIPGNHDDRDNSDLPPHSLHAFKDIENVEIIDNLGKTTLEDGTEIVGARYSKNTDMVKEFIKDSIDDTKNQILLAHLGVDGGYVGAGSYPMSEAFTVDDLFPDKYQFVILGHFHRKQTLEGQPNVLYTGAPIQHSFSDEGEDKGFWVFDTEEGTKEFHPIENPKFVTVTEVNKEELIKHAEKGNYIRANLKEDEVQDFLNTVPQGLKYKVNLKKEYKEESRANVKIGMDFSEVVSNYAKEYKPEAEDTGLHILKLVEDDM